MEQLRNLVDEARGGESYASIAFRLGESEQWLSNKLRGARKINVPEVVRIAAALDSDPVAFVNARWPELAQADRLAGIRARLAGAADAEIAEVESWLDTRKGPESAPARHRRAR